MRLNIFRMFGSNSMQSGTFNQEKRKKEREKKKKIDIKERDF